jgi:GINS complex subunit 1
MDQTCNSISGIRGYRPITHHSNEDYEENEQFYAPKEKLCLSTFSHDKSVILCYLQERLSRLRSLRLEQTHLPETVSVNCSQQELEYYDKYNKILSGYIKSVDCDITSDTKPPKDSYVEIMMTKTLGLSSLECGTFNLLKDSVYHLKRSDAESLIRQDVAKLM